MDDVVRIENLIRRAEQRLIDLESERKQLCDEIKNLKQMKDKLTDKRIPFSPVGETIITNRSSIEEKISLFRHLFRGREDVYAKRWENRAGKSGYQPACENEWVSGICGKPSVKCSDCPGRYFLPLTDSTIRRHLEGEISSGRMPSEHTIGVYPLLSDETCCFLAIDFDKRTWMQDAGAFMKTCTALNIPVALERSRSGSGGHVWIFFSEPVPAVSARRLGSFLITETMERRPGIGLDSYDRLFPNQDTIPRGGFGNLIALPLQKMPSSKGNSLFLSDDGTPFEDQWLFLSRIRKMNPHEVEAIVAKGASKGRILGIHAIVTEDEAEQPWEIPPSKKLKHPVIKGPLPDKVIITQGSQLFIEKKDLPPSLINNLIRLAAFQNPEFYRAQVLRLSTFGKPRIICCAEDYPHHLSLPRGCLAELTAMLETMGISWQMEDKRSAGHSIAVRFIGELNPDQQKAAEAVLAHDIGVLSATTAFGKTVIGIHILARRAVNTLILVHRRQLMDQWIASISAFLQLDLSKIGKIGEGKYNPTKNIDVALLQSLGRNFDVDDIVADYGHVIVDECHHIPASSFENVLRRCRARYVLGLSATITRKDGHHPIIFMQCGPVRYNVSARKQAVERPFSHHVITRRTHFKYDPPVSEHAIAITDIYTALVQDADRNEMIFDDVLKSLEKGRSPLVITERKDHLDFLAERFSKFARNVIVMKGGMGARQRKEVSEKMASIPDHEERLILATGRYLGEGFDDSRLDTLFLTMPISWRGTLAQYAGRLHRLHYNKTEVIIYDYVDSEIPVMKRMYERRLRGYRALGYSLHDEKTEVPVKLRK
ncbi:MAG: DEAD/DEAH box helicase [Deltaproteobacteria bacterium]|nr:DEAD/DEAH box helicase [Deltaproteobacteria bacterium]